MPRFILTLGLLLGALSAALVVSGCGGDDDGQFANEATGEFPVQIIDANFKKLQTVAQTYDLTIAVRNSGDETIPAINTVIDLPGKGSTLAFAYGDKQPGLAMNQRPVWVVEEGWPKLADTVARGGATTPDRRTFEFGKLKPGDTANMVWRVVAVRPGNYLLKYQISAGLGPDTSAVDANGNVPTGVLPVHITDFARLTKVNAKGQVVPVSRAEQAHVEAQQESANTGLNP
ncbi:MAG TPA: hypothetical protein P5138_05955 [Solirubrobacterales bacterium]|nr:hypothetical protein [Solirubrobacterales bacterium]